jgi:hypothetical protein
VERENARVLECGENLYLAKESLRPNNTGDLGSQDFDSYLAVVPVVPGEVDICAAARSELFHEIVAAGELGTRQRAG